MYRRRRRLLRQQDRIELALQVALGRKDMSRTLPWSTYARKPASKPPNTYNASLFGGPPRRKHRDSRAVGLTSCIPDTSRSAFPPDHASSAPRQQQSVGQGYPPGSGVEEVAVNDGAVIDASSSWPMPPTYPAPVRRRPLPPEAAVALKPVPPLAPPPPGSRRRGEGPRGYQTKMDPCVPRRAPIAMDVEEELFALYGPHPALNERFRYLSHAPAVVPPAPRPAWESPRRVRDAAALLVAEPVAPRSRTPTMHGVKLQPGMQYLDIGHLKSQPAGHSDVPRLPPI